MLIERWHDKGDRGGKKTSDWEAGRESRDAIGGRNARKARGESNSVLLSEMMVRSATNDGRETETGQSVEVEDDTLKTHLPPPVHHDAAEK